MKYNVQSIRRRFETREMINNLKTGPCVDCGSVYHPCQMEFQRKDGKKSTISRLLLRSQKAILMDTQLYDLLCANCGRFRTWERQRKHRSGTI